MVETTTPSVRHASRPVVNSEEAYMEPWFALLQPFVPLIAHLRTRSRCYVYDSATNQILELDEALWTATQDDRFWELIHTDPDTLLKCYPDLSQEHLDALTNSISELGVFSTSRAQHLQEPLSEADYSQALRQCLGHLVLEVTQQCNLRCAYCVFSGHYEAHRRHNNSHMSEWH